MVKTIKCYVSQFFQTIDQLDSETMVNGELVAKILNDISDCEKLTENGKKLFVKEVFFLLPEDIGSNIVVRNSVIKVRKVREKKIRPITRKGKRANFRKERSV
jgi:hypothetical protein